VAALQQRLDRAENKLVSEAARAEGAEKLVAEHESIASSTPARAAEQRKAEAAAAQAAHALRSELERRAADAEAAALAARAAAELASTMAGKQLAELQAQCFDLQSTLTRERALVASRAAATDAEATSELAVQRWAAEAGDKQRNEVLASFGARVQELEGAVRASQVRGLHGSARRLQQPVSAASLVSDEMRCSTLDACAAASCTLRRCTRVPWLHDPDTDVPWQRTIMPFFGAM
jgi:hypothetical protein